MLCVNNNQVVTAEGRPNQLKGVSIGGWMNMEDFIVGYPGAEHTLRHQMAEALGKSKAQVFFDRLHEHFLSNADIAFIKAQGANFVRIPLNYRHFETDDRPFEYLEQGFKRLDKVISWCAQQKLYVVLDLHAAQGWQSARWHCDNANGRALLWEQKYFQDRVSEFWKAIADHYRDNETVIAYELLNEPVTGWRNGHDGQDYQPKWDDINQLYDRVIRAIREVDPHHIIVVDGDERGNLFSGLCAPPDDNMIYSSHNYSRFTLSAAEYPVSENGATYDRAFQEDVFLQHEGTRFAQQHGVPLWIGEFGAMYNVPPEQAAARLQALDDQLTVFEAYDAHWTAWTYKDVGIMGWVHLDPESDYMQMIAPIIEAKQQFNADFASKYREAGKPQLIVYDMLRLMNDALPSGKVVDEKHHKAIAEQMLHNFFGILMQPAYARLFKDLSETRLDEILQAFAFENCVVHQGLNGVLKRHFDL